MSLRVGEPLAFRATRARPQRLEALTERIAAEDGMRLEAGVVDHLVVTSSVDALARAIRIADELGMRCWLDVAAADAASLATEAGTILHERETPIGRLALCRHGEVVTERVELAGVSLRTTVVSDAGAGRELHAPPSLGSPRLAAFAKLKQIVRAPTPELGDDAPAWPALQRLETTVGGVIAPWSHDPIARPALLLGLGISELAAKGGLHEEWCWQPEDDEDEDDVCELEVRGWPRFAYRGVELLFVGEHDHRHYLLMDEEGVLWRYEHELGFMEIVAGDGMTLLELMALDSELWARPAWAKTTVACRAGEAVARALSLSRDPASSDGVVQSYDDGALWVRQVAGRGPIQPKLEIIADDPQRVVEAVRCAREIAPEAAVAVQRTRPGGRERAEALREAGLIEAEA